MLSLSKKNPPSVKEAWFALLAKPVGTPFWIQFQDKWKEVGPRISQKSSGLGSKVPKSRVWDLVPLQVLEIVPKVYVGYRQGLICLKKKEQVPPIRLFGTQKSRNSRNFPNFPRSPKFLGGPFWVLSKKVEKDPFLGSKSTKFCTKISKRREILGQKRGQKGSFLSKMVSFWLTFPGVIG